VSPTQPQPLVVVREHRLILRLNHQRTSLTLNMSRTSMTSIRETQFRCRDGRFIRGRNQKSKSKVQGDTIGIGTGTPRLSLAMLEAVQHAVGVDAKKKFMLDKHFLPICSCRSKRASWQSTFPEVGLGGRFYAKGASGNEQTRATCSPSMVTY
jgi:hypothetical protein